MLLEVPRSLGSPRASLLFGSSGINPVGTHLQILHPVSLSDGNLLPSSRMDFFAAESCLPGKGQGLGVRNQAHCRKGVASSCHVKVLCECPSAKRATLALGLGRAQCLCFVCCVNGQVGDPQVEKERHLGGSTEHSSTVHVAAVPSLFSRTAPDGPQEAPILYSSSTGLSFCPLAAGEGRSLHFHKQLNAGALSGAFLLSRLSFLRRMCRASFNLGINLTKVQNLLLCMENALHAVVYLSSSHPPPPCFTLIFGA